MFQQVSPSTRSPFFASICLLRLKYRRVAVGSGRCWQVISRSRWSVKLALGSCAEADVAMRATDMRAKSAGHPPAAILAIENPHHSRMKMLYQNRKIGLRNWLCGTPLPLCQRLADEGRDPSRQIGLLHEVIHIGRKVGRAQMAGGDDRLDARMPGPDIADKIDAIERARHLNVGEDQRYGAVLVEQVDGLLRGRGLQDLIALGAQVIADIHADQELVFDYQQCFAHLPGPSAH